MALLIVQSIPVDQRLLPSMEWVRLDCLRLRHDGSVLAAFAPLIRISALTEAIRPTRWLPSEDDDNDLPRLSPLLTAPISQHRVPDGATYRPAPPVSVPACGKES
ncbi:hypothetical protein [Couchioplanes azureus]|uniref:hypothetical protein n=1 Tax=Couchioplanes caeruleus TaxID=56438 RepID=UPI00166FE3B9|nr:hypothetical protein [Couchioplanes caeruleus]